MPDAAASPRAAAGPGASPCVGVCALDPQGQVCVGCWRTVDEIAAWRDASVAWREQCLQRLAQREQAAALTPPAPPSRAG